MNYLKIEGVQIDGVGLYVLESEGNYFMCLGDAESLERFYDGQDTFIEFLTNFKSSQKQISEDLYYALLESNV